MSALSRSTPGRAEPALRVLTLGATGFEQALRLRADVELVRCADALEAVGELSDPIDALSPVPAVVLVSHVADLGGVGAQDLCESLRRVDPGVRIVALARASQAIDRALYDEVLDPDAGERPVLEAVLKAALHAAGGDDLGGPSPSPPPEPPTKPQAPEPARAEVVVRSVEPKAETRPAPPAVKQPDKPEPQRRPEPTVRPEPPAAPSAAERAGATPAPAPIDLEELVVAPPSTDANAEPPVDASMSGDDLAILRALLGDADVVPPALALIAQRSGHAGVRFVREGERLPKGPAVEVRGPAGRFGWLCVPGEHDARSRERVGAGLARHAEWLSHWLRLSARQRDLRHAAFTDPLTGAWNRRYFERYLGAAIDRAKSARIPLTVMVFDIDNFKAYNDRHGHGAGDEILSETVRLLGSTIRPTDRVCRIGGDEFAVIFFEPDGPRDATSRPPESIYQIARRFQQQICQHRFPKLGAHAQGTLTISGGLATYPWDGTDAGALLRRADELALRSKAQGKNALTFGPGATEVCQAPQGDAAD
ncbi:MAG: diguanylate cyclase [Planctomycetota bacterium]